MNGELLTIYMFCTMGILLFSGIPIAFAMGIVAVVFGYILWGPASVFLLSTHMTGVIFNYTLLAVPLFLFMANVLKESGIAEDIYDAMYKWMGGLHGGLAIGSIIACAIIGALSGVSAVGVMAMGTMALPAMLARGYDKRMATGTILAGGALGQLIPPSILALVFSSIANISIGKMFLAGVIPGFILTILFIVYISVRSFINKDLCPPLSKEALAQITAHDKWMALVKNLPALLIIVAVLGSLFAGLASPTESAAVGAATSLLLAGCKGKLTKNIMSAILADTVKATSMVMWIATSSLLFVAVYSGVGGAKFVSSILLGLDMSPGAIVSIMLLIVFVLGFFMDPTGILYLVGPIFVPIVIELGYSPLWFGGMLIVNLETAYLTPPFGYNLFYLKSVANNTVSTKDLYLSTPPFILIQVVAIITCVMFPEVITWLPTALLGE